MAPISRSLLWALGMAAAIATNSIMTGGIAAFVLVSWSIGTGWTALLIGFCALAWIASTWDDRKEIFRFRVSGSEPSWVNSLVLLGVGVFITFSSYVAWGSEHPVRVAQIGIVAIGLGLVTMTLTAREYVSRRAHQLYYF